MKSRYSLFCSAILLSSFLPATSSFAQSKIKDGSVTGSVTLPSSNAILELESTNKGFLLPRITLSSTTSFAPLSAHVEGITVYNTATAGDVVPGYYYNDGAKWVRLADAAAADQTKDAWVDDHTNMQVKMGTRSDGTTVRPDSTAFVVKDDGRVGIGLVNPAGLLDINGKMYVNNQQTIYNAYALNSGITGSLFVGNGGQNLDTADISAYEEADNNVGVGMNALLRVTSGEGNTAVGVSALEDNTSGRLNTATGVSSLPANTTGTGNSGYGVNAMYSNTTGDYNVGLGGLSLFSNTAGSSNTAIGYSALSRNTANGNTAAGRNAGWSISTGVNNTVVGYYLNQINRIITTGSYNTIMGYNSGIGITSGANNTILGSRVTIPASDSTMSNNIILADGAGNQRIRVLSDGKTGVGTTTPQKQLHVNGALQITNELNVGGNATTAGSAGTNGQVLVSGGSGVAPAWATAGSIADTSKDAWVDDNANSMVKLGTRSNGTTVRSAGTEMVIKDDGKVGIGTPVPTAYLDINNLAADSTGLRIRNLSNSSNKQDKQISYTKLGAPLYADNNGRLYKKNNPVATALTATTFDTTKTIWNDSTTASADFISLNGGSLAGAGIIRFQIYEGPMFFGVSGVGANIYADITYSWSNGFRVSSFGSSAGGSSSNMVTVIGGNGDGAQRLEFHYASGDCNLVIKNEGGKSGTLRIYYVGPDRGTADVDFFQTFRSR